MKLKLDNKSVQDCLTKVVKLTQAEHACMEVRNGELYVSALNKMQYVRLHIIGEVIEKSKSKGFVFKIQTLSKLVRNNKSITIEIQPKKLKFFSSHKSSKVKGEFSILPYEKYGIEDVDKGKSGVSLSSKEIRSISNAIKKIDIKPLHAQVISLPLYVMLTSKGLHAYMADNYHFAYYMDKSVKSKKEMKFDLPIKLYSNIEYISQGSPFKMNINENYIYVYGTGFEMCLPVLQVDRDKRLDLKKIKEHSKSTMPKNSKDKSFNVLDITIQDLLKSVDTLDVVSEGFDPLHIKSINNKLMMMVKSSLGSMQELSNINISSWEKKSYIVNKSLLQDILMLYPVHNKAARFYFKGSFMSTQWSYKNTQKVVYVCALLNK